MTVRRGSIVPLRKVADQSGHVLRGMDNIRSRNALHRIGVIPDEQNDRHAIAISAVNRHCRVLQTYSAVAINRHRLAFNLEVAV